MSICAVTNCPSRGNDGNFRFHRFPSENKDLGLWLDFCDSKGKLNMHNSVVCSKHFKKEDYTLLPVLKKGVIPTQFSPKLCLKTTRKKTHFKTKSKDDGSVVLPVRTKSGRMVVTPAAYQDDDNDDSEDEHDNENDDDDDDSDINDHNSQLNDEEILKRISDPNNDLFVLTGEDVLMEEENKNITKNVIIEEADSSCSCCQEQIKIEREARKIFENKLEKERQKLKEEKKRRKHLEKLLGASMQKQKATELRAQVAEEALKIYCPVHFLTGSSLQDQYEGLPDKMKINKAMKETQKGRWGWKKTLDIKTDHQKKKKKVIKNNYNLNNSRSNDFTSVELIDPESPSDPNTEDTTVILVQEDSDTPIISYYSQKESPFKKKRTIEEDEDDLPSNEEDEVLGDRRKKSSSDGFYSCSDCPFRSVFKSELAQHSKKHKATKKYVCSVCLFSSEKKTLLMEHMLSHKINQVSDSKKRVFQCSQCSYLTTEKYLIVEHERSHFDEKVKRELHSIKSVATSSITHDKEDSRNYAKQLHSCAKCNFAAPHMASLIVHCTFNCPGNET